MFAEVWTGADYLWCHVNINNGHKNASKQTLLLIEGGKKLIKASYVRCFDFRFMEAAGLWMQICEIKTAGYTYHVTRS